LLHAQSWVSTVLIADVVASSAGVPLGKATVPWFVTAGVVAATGVARSDDTASVDAGAVVH
jgi:hypothetical protein